MSTFKLDPRLGSDSLFIADLQVSELRLFNRQELLWLLLVPKVPDITEFYQLNEAQHHALIAEINLVSHMIKTHFSCDKLNIATLGNLVPQLHVHIIARRFDDPFWPKPAFGLLEQTYEPGTAQALIHKIRTLL